MKVLMISPWYPNDENPFYGIFIKNHAYAIKDAGVEIQLLVVTVGQSKSIFKKSISRLIDEKGLVTHVISLKSKYHNLLFYNYIFQYLIVKNYYHKHLEKEFTPDIIHSNIIFPAAFLGYKLAIIEKKAHVITEHWSKIDRFMNMRLLGVLGKKVYNDAAAITVVSSFLKNKLANFINDEEKLNIIPNVIDLENLSRYNQANDQPDTIRFTCMSLWEKPKRPELLFHALQGIVNQVNRRIVLNVAGCGSLLNELKSIRWDFEVRYLGSINHEAKIKVFGNTDYFLHASDMETFSVVIAEAMAAGIPVLASNVGAIPELISSENGLMCNNNVDEWSEAILSLVSSKIFDREVIKKTASRFDKASVGGSFKKLYMSTLKPQNN